MLSRRVLSTFLSTAAGKGEGQLPWQLEVVGGGHLFLVPTTTPEMREVVPAMPLSYSQGWLTKAPVYWITSTVPPMGGGGSILPSAAASEGVAACTFIYLLSLKKKKLSAW